jgi:hypothetical protein
MARQQIRTGAHGRDRTQRGDHAIQAISEDATLNSGIEHLAVDFEARNIAGGGNITDGFHGANHVDR